ncbi:MAG: bifunctional 4-hydroxy-3-methylbut-2-enyl diphosphate reductase/30S ribosomal protein S1 [Anaeromicrobium sp.]|uniref:bifunctional 4-hydroxy-3-methylbut-2-enyl diphosphate reductase/30S ribosomal protein S1 n=1 Tax=Anaeromicrobium sp. TaxID=1929132 RepID=UPI0025D21FE9|nr:bifunctional 4-hydroxy-3-methylbut-2-enyl diphosphate reductase/30S ribosomal protein S1 [Anaeromicrobium sp.]MCT4594709.1 bifunctional 4-hydroxy-3-methylbut-2-enyl diphosphate reductase/30S ribosomal protein S1 [Anaeromicrobium sp.]
MKIEVAKNAGFCFGVKKAMNETLAAAKKYDSIYTYGPLIHNNQVIDKLENEGIKAIEALEEVKNSTLIIRSHGIPLKVYERAKDLHIEIIDCTCPFVRKVQKIAKEYGEKGYNVVIIGNSKHPEVIGIKGWCKGNVYVVESNKDLDVIPNCDKICVVAQTTITRELWNNITNELKNKTNELEMFNTICAATKERQMHCAELAKNVDAMIVIGGYHSSNTQKLYKISKEYCKKSYHIETADELPIKDLKDLNRIGITAGASTPDWIIKEAIEKMSDIQQEQNDMMSMMEEIEKSLVMPRRGTIVKGTVVQVTEGEVVVNIGYKSDGVIPRSELAGDSSVDPRTIIKEGEELEVCVLKSDDGEGNVLLSKKRVDAEKHWKEIEKIFEDKETIVVKVSQVVKGGVIALYKELRGFIPASQLSLRFVKDLDKYVGQELSVKVIEFKLDKKKLVLSHRIILEAEREERENKVWENIQKEKVVQGTVKRLAAFGAFVDIGGIDGLVHISDISWGRVNDPKDVLKEEDKVEVKILDFDREKGKVSLGIKQLLPQPWEVADEKYEVGEVVEGKVVRLVDFGAFVEVEPGLDGLVHISQICEKHISKADEVLKIGETVKAKILELDKEKKRMSLSIKDAQETSVEE